VWARQAADMRGHDTIGVLLSSHRHSPPQVAEAAIMVTALSTPGDPPKVRATGWRKR
jgi:hypothetical protein